MSQSEETGCEEDAVKPNKADAPNAAIKFDSTVIHSMKMCEYCGRENQDEAAVCHECGTSEFVATTRFAQ